MHAIVGSVLVLTALPAALPGAWAVPQQEATAEPFDSDLEERVEVQLVLVDVVVVDGRVRTVPDLGPGDFELVAGGNRVEIASLDVYCPAGAAEEPRADAALREIEPEQALEEARRIVLVFDYYHMENASRALQAAQETLDRWSSGSEEHMVVSLGQVLRVEAPFTSDVEHVRLTLEKMRTDPALYAGSYGRLTERRFFRRMESLFDLLERFPGRKAVVLFSGPFKRDGFEHDPAYKTLAAMSSTARCAVYPVDVGGLRTPLDPLASKLGGPPRLRRLANETGGRMTSDTNDVSLAYAKARRDLGCVYTLGFYDRSGERDRKRRIKVRVRNDERNLRVVHPAHYFVRSQEQKRKSLTRTAAMAPEMFPHEGLTVDLFPVRPHGVEKWEVLLAVRARTRAPEAARRRPRFDQRLPAGEGGDWGLEVYIRTTAGTPRHSLKRRLPAPASVETPVTVFDGARIRPGRYVVSAVLSHPGSPTPLAARREVVVPQIPRNEPFLVGPILGRHSAGAHAEDESVRRLRGLDDLPIVKGAAGGTSFEPLVLREASREDSLAALTRVCVVQSGKAEERGRVIRALRSEDGVPAVRFDPARFALEGDGEIRCTDLVDALSADGLDPGAYDMTAELELGAGGRSAQAGARFTVRPQLAK